jgi:hypothetical protein
MENRMKFSKTLLSTAVLLTSSLAMANTYNGEVSLDYADFDNDLSAISLQGVYHFTPVDTANKPLAEAAFLERRSFLNAGHTEFDYDGGSSDMQNIGFGFYIPNTIFYVGAEYQKLEDENDTVVTLGITPADGLLITTNHSKEADDYNANISAKYVTKLAGDTAINLEAGYAKGADAEDEFEEDEEDTISLAADYYFTSFFSVGAILIDEADSAYGLRTRYFFNDNVSMNAQIVSSDDADAYSIGAAFRF